MVKFRFRIWYIHIYVIYMGFKVKKANWICFVDVYVFFHETNLLILDIFIVIWLYPRVNENDELCELSGNLLNSELVRHDVENGLSHIWFQPIIWTSYIPTDMKPLVHSYIQKLVQTKWDVAVHGRDLYLVKPTLGPPKKFQHLTRAEEVVITRLRIGHTKATKSHILSRGPPTGCHHYGQTLTIDHMLLECTLLQECRDEYYTVDSLNALFETIPETCIVEFLREAGFFYLI